MKKLKISAFLLGIVTLLLSFRFPESVMGMASIIFFFFALALFYFDYVYNCIPESSFLDRFTQEYKNSTKAKNKIDTMTPEEQDKVAKQFIRELGSDTQCIKLKILKKD